MPCPRFSQQVLGVRSPEDRQSQQAVEFTRSGVQGSFTPGLLLMAPSDASTSHLSWCKCPWGCRTITAPRIQKLPRGERNGSSVGLCWPCSPLRFRGGEWSGVWPPQGEPEFSVQLLSQREAPFLGRSLGSSVWAIHPKSRQPVCLMSTMLWGQRVA